MFKFYYQIERVRNMAKEWLRLTELYTTKSDRTGKNRLQSDWQMNSTNDDNFGRPYQIHRIAYYGVSETGERYRSGTEDVKVKRDIFDQVMDTLRDIRRLYWRNIFKEETCTHPHDHVYIEWDGDREYGYYSQHICYKCGSYINEKNIDRYLPPEDRHPDLIKGNPVHPMDRQKSKGEEMWDNRFDFLNEDDPVEY